MKKLFATLFALTVMAPTAIAGPFSTIMITDDMQGNHTFPAQVNTVTPLYAEQISLVNQNCNYDNLREKRYGNVRVHEDDLQPLAYKAELTENVEKISHNDLYFLRAVSSQLAMSGNSYLYISPHQALRICNVSIAITGTDILELVE